MMHIADDQEDDDPLPVHVPAQRRCLSCSKPFQSRSASNRICYRCHRLQNWRDGSTEYSMALF
jgi:hypothetical protein